MKTRPQLDLTRPEHMCQVCNRNTCGTERVRLKRGGRFVASMHAQCAFGVRWDEDAIAEPVPPDDTES
jgi:hypothetical protein